MLGVSHMSNPGHDLFNTQADDILAPKRQGEIAELIAVLKKVQPTKIAVEADFSDSRTARNHSDYLAGTHQLTEFAR